MPKRVNNTNKQRKVKKPSDLTRGKIIAYYEEGKSQRNISEIVSVPRTTVRNIINTYKETNDIKRRVGSGRKRKTTKREDNIMSRMAKINPFVPSREVSKNMLLDHNVQISHQTVSRRLKENGLGCYVAKKKPYISKSNIKKRLEWAQDHKDWTIEDWKKVLWCDESPFTLSYHGRQWVWRPKGKAYDPKYIKPTFKHGGGNIQVWGCFSWYGVGDLYQINGTLVCVFVYVTTK